MILVSFVVGPLRNGTSYGNECLDLVYVTPRVIAAGMPAEGLVQKFYHMHARSLETFLDDQHKSHWHIFNLQENSELGYDPIAFGGSSAPRSMVSRYPIKDHNPAPIATLVRIVRDIQGFLDLDQNNVALVHCKLGKGRTGMVISAYLIAALSYTPEAAMKEFTAKRIRVPFVDGVSITSQRRYLKYIETFYQQKQDPGLLRQGRIQIVEVIFHNPRAHAFELSLEPLDPALASDGRWVLTRRSDGTQVKPADPQPVLCADLLANLSVYYEVQGVRIPLAHAAFSFNASFEGIDPANVLANKHLVDPNKVIRCTLRDRNLLPAARSKGGPKIRRFICNWNMTDGWVGTWVRGKRLFDYIEIVWREMPDIITR